GQAEHPDLKPVARALFERFPCPLLEVVFRHRKQWQIESMKPASPADLDEREQDLFAAAFDRFSSMVWRKPRTRRRYRFDLAMLVNPEEEMPPSDEAALKRFERAGRKLGINVERITRRDYMRLPEYDGLFIRETTAIDHHTYRFARKAEAEGLAVIDDPVSILRCTNTVFLADLLKNNKVTTPQTLIRSKGHTEAVERVANVLGCPVVIKMLVGAFSRGAAKAKAAKELKAGLKELFKQSPLVLAQEY